MDKKLREYLLKQVIKLERQSLGGWIKQITFSAIKILESGKKVPVKVDLEKEVDWDEISPDVRAEFLHRQKSQIEIDVTKSRDRENL